MTRKLQRDYVRAAYLCNAPGCVFMLRVGDVRDLGSAWAHRAFSEHDCGEVVVLAHGDRYAEVLRASGGGLVVSGDGAVSQANAEAERLRGAR